MSKSYKIKTEVFKKTAFETILDPTKPYNYAHVRSHIMRCT